MNTTTHQTWRDDPRVPEMNTWLVSAGVFNQPREEMLEAYCIKLRDLGVPLLRFHATHSAMHPVYGALGFDWEKSSGPARHEYLHVSNTPENWLVSPFNYMLSQGLAELHQAIPPDGPPSRFPLLDQMKERGARDYFAQMLPFQSWEAGQPLSLEDAGEGAMMSWMTDAPDGFSQGDIALLRATFPTLCLVLKSGTHRQTAENLLGVYLGRDAGRRVLSGEIQRGSSRWIDAVICYFDLEGFTNLSQRIEGEALIAMLNDYFGRVVHRIEDHGGNVLKFMGDGLLAIFDRAALGDAPDRALAALRDLDRDMAACSDQRQADGLPAMGYTVALHAGRVLYGNIGADERLDFTVIGPEVNLAARLSGMHRALGQRHILSDAVVRDVTAPEFELISLGRYMLRGVEHPRELFTVYTP